MKQLRKWSRILHRDIGFFFIGTTILYGLSGIALNHMSDWNPNYTVELKNFKTSVNLEKTTNPKNNILKLLTKSIKGKIIKNIIILTQITLKYF